MHGDGWGGWIAGAIMMIAFWGSLAVLVALAIRWTDDRRAKDENSDPGVRTGAREILAERFVRGEISADEFEERRAVLERRDVRLTG
jgi:putative membrane protein